MKRNRKIKPTVIFTVGLLLISMMFCFSSCCWNAKKTFSSTWVDVFDTVVVFTAVTDTRDKFDDYSTTLHEELVKYHKLFDIYNTYEDIVNIAFINQKAGNGTSYVVDENIIQLLTLCKDYYDITQGKLNIMMGPVLKIWHNARKIKEVPSMETLQEAQVFCSFDYLNICVENNSVCIENSNASIDVGAVAKGYAVQKVADMLVKMGLCDFLINAGGNVYAHGSRSDGKDWKVGIESPFGKENVAVIDVSNQSVVTSGDYQRYFEVNGTRYHHIIDTNTLFPCDKYKSVSVVGKDSGVCDILSTSLFLMNFEEGLALINGLDGYSSMWVFEDETYKYSDTWPNLDTND